MRALGSLGGLGVALLLVAPGAAAQIVSSPTIAVSELDMVNKTGPNNWHADSPISTFTHNGVRYWLHANGFGPQDHVQTQHQKLRGTLDFPFG